MANTVILFDASNAIVGAFGTIQEAIDAAGDNYTILASAGTYTESLSITKAITLTGEDLGGDGVPDVIINPVGANGISISGDIDNGGSATVTISGVVVDGATNSGVAIASSTNLSNLVIANSEFSHNGVHGVGSGSGASNLDSISITNSTFEDNGQGGANGSGDIVLFGFTGDATIRDVTITSTAVEATPVASRGDNAIQISGFNPATYDVTEPMGTVTLDNVSVDGWYHKPQLLIQGYTDFNGLSLTDVDLNGGTSWGDLLFVDPIVTSGDGAPGVAGQPGNFLLTGGTSTLDLSGVTINSGSTSVLGLDSRVRGTDADDNITGTNGADLLNDVAESGIDYGGDDTVSSGDGDDFVIGGRGNDSLDGGAGHDTALFFGNGADYSYTVTKDASGFVTGFTSVTDNNIADGDEGADVLSSVESIVALGDGAALDAAQPVQLFDASDVLIGTFDTIQEAVDAAGDGDSILVSAGTYREQVVVNNIDNLTITGIGDVTIEAPDVLAQTTTSTSGRSTFAIATVIDSANVVFDNVNIDGRGITTGLAGASPNVVGVYYRNSSGGLENVDVTAIRDPYPGGVTVGGEPIVSGNQRGVGVIADNDAGGARLGFFMHGGAIDDFQKNATAFVHADLDISGVMITGGGAQPVIAQNGIQALDSTGSITGNTIIEIGYAGPSFVYSGSVLAFDNTDLDIKDNVIVGTNDDTPDSKVAGVFVFDSSGPISGGVISGNTISQVDIGIGVYGDIQPNQIAISGNTVSDIDLADPFAAGVDLEPNPGLATAFSSEGSAIGDILFGSDANDSLAGLAGDDTIAGGIGDDWLSGGAGADAIDGGDGVDTASYEGSLAGVSVDLGAGTASGGDAAGDTLTAIENLVGSIFGDMLAGDALANSLAGGAGDDTLRGAAGADMLDGGAGDDSASYEGSAAGVAVDLGAGTASGGDAAGDTLTGIENLIGSSHNDALAGSAAANHLSGGDGDDTLTGGAGADTLDGGAGLNTASYAGSPAGVTVDLGAGTASGGDAAGDVLVAIANVTGSASADRLTGDAADNVLVGNAGDDTLSGADGDDNLFAGFGDDRADGGSGNDLILSGPGKDTLLGGDGNDTLGASNRSDLLRGEGGNDLLLGSNGHDRLFGGDGDDTLLGGNGRDTLSGDSGADRLIGGNQIDTASYAGAGAGVWVRLWAGDGLAGDALGDVLIEIENLLGSAFNDTLVGSNGTNRLSGGGGDDRLLGLDGADQINGGAGDDTLNGGAGNDAFLFFSNAPGADVITDFTPGAGTDDVIRLFGFGAAFDSFAEVQAAASQVGADTVIDFGGGNSITLEGVTLGDLHADDFLFG